MVSQDVLMNLHIKLLTYNVFIRPPGIRNNFNDYKDERLECMISTDLGAEKLIKSFTSQSGVPYSLYTVDKDRFPTIPYLSPWRSPRPPKLLSPVSERKLKEQHQRYAKLDTSILGQYDIICFQELFSAFSYRQRRFLERATAQGFKYHATSPLPSYLKSTFLVDGGVAIISKYPIVKQEYLLYQQGVDSDMLAAKGAIYAKIEIEKNKHYIHLFSTHLQASYVHPNSTTESTDNVKNDSVRTKQLNQLREFMHLMTSNDQYPIILAGDLNVDSRVSKTSHDSGSDTKEYLEMIDLISNKNHLDGQVQLFEMLDLLKNDTGLHPPTVGDATDVNGVLSAKETALTNKNDYCCMKSLDYIFLVNRIQPSHLSVDNADSNQKNHNNNNNILVPGTTKVEPFFIEGFPFSQLSDHYGVSTELKFV
ncbi:putative sphingomyelinase [Heterostelium album PN500]|uniref:sphingomyelin phosphodiesterase n=1 Tax=Heterostelium pallidum (strain ATCC 26659 / Pp 5 / PN500) TaxID=670386 RepID=D3BSB2_HETP5|nr:putative sphingomyelinase [Heterostelium album PN500]EFA75685.1 putative sphingomyelinase [Heterostelium album PN500]|eukprot:XP_020427819.1 putative sphingomyelinase [Heterostelium album PN500]